MAMNRSWDGGPAFARISTPEFEGSPGMSLRDYFAGQVMAQCMRNMGSPPRAPAADVAEGIARAAYFMADAMIAERTKKREGL